MAKTKPVRPEYLAVGRRIRLGMQTAHLDQSAVARALGVEPQSVQQWLSGQTMPRGYRIKALAALLNVEPWELLGAADEAAHPAVGATRSSTLPPESHAQRSAYATVRRVPRVSWVSAGLFREMETLEGQPQAWDVSTEPLSPKAFSLWVDGDSMEPEFPRGCIIFVEPCSEALNGDFVVVTLDDTHQATFKQLVIDGSRRYLKPLNPRYPLITLERDAHVCGVVREMRKCYRPAQATA